MLVQGWRVWNFHPSCMGFSGETQGDFSWGQSSESDEEIGVSHSTPPRQRGVRAGDGGSFPSASLSPLCFPPHLPPS